MMQPQYLNKHDARTVSKSRAVITGKRKVAIDVRVSTEHEQQMNALDNQIQWAKELGVHDDVINKAPSAGLWEGQTDEIEMGTTYDMIDAVLEGRLDEVPQKDQDIIARLHRISEHKRHTAAAPPKF